VSGQEERNIITYGWNLKKFERKKAAIWCTILLSFAHTFNNRQQHEMPQLVDRRLPIATRQGVMIGSPIFQFAGPTDVSIGRLISNFVKEDHTEL
jgi:hypothetical protein